MKRNDIATFLSVVFPGLGQFFKRHNVKGLAYFGMIYGNLIVAWINYFRGSYHWTILCAIAALGLWVQCIKDAYESGQDINFDKVLEE